MVPYGDGYAIILDYVDAWMIAFPSIILIIFSAYILEDRPPIARTSVPSMLIQFHYLETTQLFTFN